MEHWKAYLVAYLIIGGLLAELTSKSAQRQGTYMMNSVYFVVVLFWPLILLISIIRFMKR